jgi:hypothetical protein
LGEAVNELGKRPRHGDGLEVNDVADGLVVYQPHRDRVHFLNATAALAFELCTGANSLEEIVRAVRVAFDLAEAPTSDIEMCLAQLRQEGLIE